VGDGSPGGEAEDAAAAQARSGVLGAAIQARLDRGDTAGANALLTQVQGQLDPAHAGPLQGQIATAQRFDAAQTYADQFAPSAPSSSAEEVEAQRNAALRQAALDHSEDSQQQALAGHFINQRFNSHLEDGRVRTMELTEELRDWLSKAPRGELERKLPMPALWNKLNPEDQDQLLKQLDQNGRPDGANAGGSIAPAGEPLPAGPEHGANTSPMQGMDQSGPQQATPLQVQIQANPAGSSAITPVRYGSDEFTPIPPNLGSQPQQTRPPVIPSVPFSLPVDSGLSRGRGVAPVVEPTPGSPEYEAAMNIAVGQPVTLPDGSTIPDAASPTGNVMSPVSNLAEVAAAGKRAGAEYRAHMSDPATADSATVAFFTSLGVALGHGGTFDYQRGPGNSVTGFEQRPWFRNISNINVGLFGQQAGLTLDELLNIAGTFARFRSRNADANQPYHLDQQTRHFIERGYELGASGKFDNVP
jgi:hypothetical protein